MSARVIVRVVALAALLGTWACGGSPTQPTSRVTPPTTGTGTGTPGSSSGPVEPAAPPPSATLSVTRVLCFGDSMTEGLVSSPAQAWTLEAVGPDAYPAVLQGWLAASYPNQRFTVTNAGKAGEWAEDARTRLTTTMRLAPYDVVVILHGANDLNGLGRKGLQPTLDALENMIRDVKAAGLRAFLASLPPERPGSRAGGAADLIPEFNAGVRKVADGQRQYFVDVNAAFRNDLSLIGSDGLHPTPAGYARIAQAVFDVLRANFENRAGS